MVNKQNPFLTSSVNICRNVHHILVVFYCLSCTNPLCVFSGCLCSMPDWYKPCFSSASQAMQCSTQSSLTGVLIPVFSCKLIQYVPLESCLIFPALCFMNSFNDLQRYACKFSILYLDMRIQAVMSVFSVKNTR